MPPSYAVLGLILLLWVFSGLAAVVLIETFDETQFLIGLFNGFMGIFCYACIVVLSGHAPRLLQSVSAIVGCGALISFAVVAEYVLLLPFLGELPTGIITMLTVFWSVPVKGHIIARAIDRHWYLGIALAIAVFALQFVVGGAMSRDG